MLRYRFFGFIMIIATLLPYGAMAQDSDKLKALAAEKALLDAQAARDAAEAAAITAAVALAKAKASAADTDAAAQQGKVARDQAEVLALAAAKSLADAKAAASNQAAILQKAKLDADTALTSSEVASQTAEIAALKAAFGDAPTVGADGNVSITDATTGILLESRGGSLRAAAQLADQLCGSLRQRDIKDAFIAPPELEKKILASSFILREFDDLSRIADNADNKGTVGATVTAQIAPAAILSAVKLLQYGAGAVQTIAKMTRSDYAVALSDARRAGWLEYFLVAQCPVQVPLADVEASMRNRGFDAELVRLNRLASFVDAANAQKALQTRRLEEAKARLKEVKDAKGTPTESEQDAANSAQSLLDALAALEGPLARMKALIDMAGSKPDTFMDAIIWSRFALPEWKARPRISLVLTTQDGQITKTNWFTGKHVYGRSAGELTYRVMRADGTVLLAGYFLARHSDGEINFKMNVVTPPEGQQFPALQSNGGVKPAADANAQQAQL